MIVGAIGMKEFQPLGQSAADPSGHVEGDLSFGELFKSVFPGLKQEEAAPMLAAKDAIGKESLLSLFKKLERQLRELPVSGDGEKSVPASRGDSIFNTEESDKEEWKAVFGWLQLFLSTFRQENNSAPLTGEEISDWTGTFGHWMDSDGKKTAIPEKGASFRAVPKKEDILILKEAYERWKMPENTRGKTLLPVWKGWERLQIRPVKVKVASWRSEANGIGSNGENRAIPENSGFGLNLPNEFKPGNPQNVQPLSEAGEGGESQTVEEQSEDFSSHLKEQPGEKTVPEAVIPDRETEKSLTGSPSHSKETDYRLFQSGEMIRQKPPEGTLRLYDPNGKPVPFRQFTEQFSIILSRGSFLKLGDVQRLTVKLYPEHLGSMKIELIQKGGEMVAKILTSTETAKELLESQIASLRQVFSQQNLPVSRIDLGNFWQSENFPDRGDGDRERNWQDPEKQKQGKKSSSSFEEVLFNVEI